MEMGLKNKYIVVSGAAGGIGASIFNALLQEGAVPIGIDLKKFDGSELQKMIKNSFSEGLDYHFYQGDASDEKRMQEVMSHFKEINGLVNNAGLLGSDVLHGGRSLALFDKMMRAHAKSSFVLTELCVPCMKNGGSVVNLGSVELMCAAPDIVCYNSAKGAIWGMTVAYAITLAPRIRVNQVTPGRVASSANNAMESRAAVNYLEQRTPIKISVHTQEVADLVLFLLSDRARAITGQDYVIDGGLSKFLIDGSFLSK